MPRSPGTGPTLRACGCANVMCDHNRPPVIDWTDCPTCAGPAEIVDRVTLESTAGPVEHVKVFCVSRACNPHAMPAEMLARSDV